MHLACIMMKMTMEEALVASTINSAAALGLSEQCGSLEVGKMADLLVLNAPRSVPATPLYTCPHPSTLIHRWEHLVYQMGCHDQVIRHVIKEGQVLVSRTTPTN